MVERILDDHHQISWAIEARAQSQRLLLALRDFGQVKGYDKPDLNVKASQESRTWSSLVGAAFSLWRAAFLAKVPTPTWGGALHSAQQLLDDVLATNAIAFSTEHRLLGWTAGYYLNNAKLRLEDIR